MLLFRVIRRDIFRHAFHLKCPQYVYAQITQDCTAGITPSYLEFILRILCSSFFLPIPIHDLPGHSLPSSHNICLWGRLLSMCHTACSLHRPPGRPCVQTPQTPLALEMNKSVNPNIWLNTINTRYSILFCRRWFSIAAPLPTLITVSVVIGSVIWITPSVGTWPLQKRLCNLPILLQVSKYHSIDYLRHWL